MKRVLARACMLATLAMLTLRATSAVAEPAASLAVGEAWARATPPGATVAAVYLTIVGGSRPDRLLGANTARARMTELHAVAHAAGMTRMRPSDGVDIPARGKLVLAPEGLHLMLMEMPRPLMQGEAFEVQLRFAHAGPVDVPVQVVAPGASGPAPR